MAGHCSGEGFYSPAYLSSLLKVGFVLSHLDSEWCDQWDFHGLTLLRKDIGSLDDEDLELIVFDSLMQRQVKCR